MATHDYNVANDTGANVRSDLNGALAAIVGLNNSATAPGTLFADMLWVDTSVTPALIKQRNHANTAWIVKGYVDEKDLPAQFACRAKATPDMTVQVQAGRLFTNGSLVSQSTQTTGTITAPATNPRIDRVVIDEATGGVSVITGAEAASPSPPAITAGKLPVAQIALATSTTTITDALITDERAWMHRENDASETRKGLVELATQAEVNAGTDTGRAVVPSTLAARLDRFQYVDIFDDFIVATEENADGGNTLVLASELGWYELVGGAGADIVVQPSIGGATNPGVVALETGTTNSGKSGIFARNNTIRKGGGEITIEWLVRLADLATVGEGYQVLAGLFSSGDVPTSDGIYFRYNRSSSVNWQYVAENSSTESSSNSSVAVAEDVWVKLKIVVNAGGTSAEFFVNGTSVGTQSTNLPTGDISPALGIVKTAGTTERVLYADAFRLQQVLTAAR